MIFVGAMIGAEDPDALGVFYTTLLGEPGFRDGTDVLMALGVDVAGPRAINCVGRLS